MMSCLQTPTSITSYVLISMMSCFANSDKHHSAVVPMPLEPRDGPHAPRGPLHLGHHQGLRKARAPKLVEGVSAAPPVAPPSLPVLEPANVRWEVGDGPHLPLSLGPPPDVDHRAPGGGNAPHIAHVALPRGPPRGKKAGRRSITPRVAGSRSLPVMPVTRGTIEGALVVKQPVSSLGANSPKPLLRRLRSLVDEGPDHGSLRPRGDPLVVSSYGIVTPRRPRGPPQAWPARSKEVRVMRPICLEALRRTKRRAWLHSLVGSPLKRPHREPHDGHILLLEPPAALRPVRTPPGRGLSRIPPQLIPLVLLLEHRTPAQGSHPLLADPPPHRAHWPRPPRGPGWGGAARRGEGRGGAGALKGGGGWAVLGALRCSR
eukprot:CAMPEP_0174950698 /NCGR_PEP_ID=MMETSP1355-20121228/94469_1 /TAXON_ID=464990 /ORGANISM="Hemiselmis tepida, Strain CCMP443" /LENGTH=373 /DNA_ID=CAMNT_0016198331 /DNA_START=546 /DNA_END=1663 /DNA_ORIENTATION=+